MIIVIFVTHEILCIFQFLDVWPATSIAKDENVCTEALLMFHKNVDLLKL